MKSQYYLLGAVLLAVLLVPVFLQYQSSTGALEEIEAPVSAWDKLVSSIQESLVGEDKVVVHCDGRWNGGLKYRTIEKPFHRSVSGIGDKTFTITGELQSVYIQGWYMGSEKPSYMDVEIWVNGVKVYAERGLTHRWAPDPF